MGKIIFTAAIGKDAEAKIRLFKNYERVQTEMVRLLYEGFNITDIITNCSNISQFREAEASQMIYA